MNLIYKWAAEEIARHNIPEYRVHVTNFALKLFTRYNPKFNEKEFLDYIDVLRTRNDLG